MREKGKLNEIILTILRVLAQDDQDRRVNGAMRLRQISLSGFDYGELKKLYHGIKKYSNDENPVVAKHLAFALKDIEKAALKAKSQAKQGAETEETEHSLSELSEEKREKVAPATEKPQTSSGMAQVNDVDNLLKILFEREGSDLHLKVGKLPIIRAQGELETISRKQFSKQDMEALFARVLRPEEREKLDSSGDLDTSYSIPGLSRFRLNLLVDHHGLGAVFRTIPFKIPDLDFLAIPTAARHMIDKKHGLILVTGPTGSGKSTTLAALINHINNSKSVHIVTVEDPIEFVHNDISSHISQREVGRDTPTFSQAVVDALREDADIILVGEMRDSETIAQALFAAETGCLVLGTLHTTSAIQTMERMINAFPAEQQSQVRNQITNTLVGVISQTLLPRVGGGRIAAYELLLGTGPIRNLIRENKTAQLLSAIETARGQGMQSLDQHLAELVTAEEVTFEAALAKCSDPRGFSELEKQLTEKK